MSQTEKIARLLADVLPRLETLREAAMTEISEAQEKANAGVCRHDQAAAELGTVEAKIDFLEVEREALPNEVARADLDEDYERGEGLRERYRTLKTELDSLANQREALKEELSRLNPRGRGHPTDAAIEQLGGVAGVAHARREELEDLRDRLGKALDEMVAPVARIHESTRGTVTQLGRDRAWHESPVAKGGLRI